MSARAPQPALRSARAIVVQAGAVLLIERHRAGRHYFLFPGGKLEPGESDEAALVREVAEETGLIVRPGRPVAEVTFPDRVQSFWLATVAGGTFGAGTGPEMTGGEPPEMGTYRPVWLPLSILDAVVLYPERIARRLSSIGDGAWPKAIERFDDPFVWWA
jgi:8-oxo-dGTP diphosphatase